MEKLKRIIIFLRQHYHLDKRALALMRIGISLVILADLCIRSNDIEAFYTDSGIWPSYLIHNFGWNAGYWSLHILNGTLAFQYLLFSLHFIFAFCLLLGFKTRISTILTWILYVSLHNRNIYILQGGDDLLRLILFWSMFLPWGQRYSIDSRHNKSSTRQHTLASIAYLILIASVYLFSALLKNSSDWNQNFDALYYALSLEQLRLPLGDILYPHESILKFLTLFIYGLEWLIPLLILWPQKKNNLRVIAFISLLILHLSIGLHVYVGLFYLIGIASALALIPGYFFDRVETYFKVHNYLVYETTTSKPNSILKKFQSILIVFLILLCLMLNLGTLPYNSYQLKSELFYPVNILRLNQNWAMFAPGVLRNDGWLVYHGMDSIGRQWDLRLNQDYVDYTKPQHIVKMYKNDRWRKLAENMQNDNYTFLRPLYCKFILNQWNKEHPKKKLHTLNLYFMEKINLPNYQTSIPEKQLYCTCNAH